MSTELELERIRTAHRRYASDGTQRRRRDPRNRGLMLLMREWHDAIVDELRHREILRSTARVLDVGCGDGWLLERFAAEGVAPAGLYGIELMADRVGAARARVPGSSVGEGCASALPYDDGTFDAVCLGMVLSSIRSAALRRQVAAECRRVLAPGGVIACYELRWTNPANADVAALSTADVAGLFGGLTRTTRSVSLLPPVARRLGRTAPWLYRPLARVPMLRSRHLSFLSTPPGSNVMP